MPWAGHPTGGHRFGVAARADGGRGGGGSAAPGRGGGPPPRAHARLAGTHGGSGGSWPGCVVGAAPSPSTSRRWPTLCLGRSAPRRLCRRANGGRDRPRRRGGGRDGSPPRRPHPRGPSDDAAASSGLRRSRRAAGGSRHGRHAASPAQTRSPAWAAGGCPGWPLPQQPLRSLSEDLALGTRRGAGARALAPSRRWSGGCPLRLCGSRRGGGLVEMPAARAAV